MVCGLIATIGGRALRLRDDGLARVFTLERPTVGLDDPRLGLQALGVLPCNAQAARQTNSRLCERHRPAPGRGRVRLTSVQAERSRPARDRYRPGAGGGGPSGRNLGTCRFAGYSPYGETRTRTGDTTIFSRVLYQLSYLAARRPMLPSRRTNLPGT
jgi:hypothetical protein